MRKIVGMVAFVIVGVVTGVLISASLGLEPLRGLPAALIGVLLVADAVSFVTGLATIVLPR